MFNSERGYSLSDIAAITGNNNNDGWGGNNGWWIILLFLVFFGWGGNRGGFFGGINGGAADNYVLASDFSSLERKIDTVNGGLCDGFYSQAQLTNGVTNAIANANYDLKSAIQANAIAQMQDTNALQTQLAQCCCDNKAAVADLKYTLATDSCAINTNLSNTARDIIDNDNANYRALNDRLTMMEMDAKDNKIADLTQQISMLQLSASQAAQNTYLINQLAPTPQPAYVVANPYTGNYYGGYNGCPMTAYA